MSEIGQVGYVSEEKCGGHEELKRIKK